MRRVQRKQCEGVLEIIRRHTARDYFLSHMPNGMRLEEKLSNGGEADVSPRLPLSLMFSWLHAFLAGIEAGKQAANVTPTHSLTEATTAVQWKKNG